MRCDLTYNFPTELNCRYPIVMLFILAFYKPICETLFFRFSEYIYIHKCMCIRIPSDIYIYMYTHIEI